MTALAAPRNTPERMGDLFGFPVKAGALIHQGSAVALDAEGFAVPASSAPGLVVVGRAEATADGGTDGAFITVKRGVFRFSNDGTVTPARLGRTVAFIDDQTVAAEGAGAFGVCVALEPEGVWVRIGI